MNSKEQSVNDRIYALERRIEILAQQIDKQSELFRDEDLKIRGLK